MHSQRPYRAFIDDPAHIELLDGQRYVVLRPPPEVRTRYMQVQRAIKDRGGSTLERVRDVVKEWARVTAPLEIHVEKVSSFPAPDQIVILQMRKTTQLLDCAALNANTWHQLVASVNDSLLDVTFTAIEAEIAAFDSGREYSGGVIHFAATTAGGQRR